MSETTGTTTTTAPASAKPAATAIPGGAATPVLSTIGNDLTILKTHLVAVLVTLGLAVALTVGAVYGVEKIVAAHDLAQEEKFNVTLTAQVQQTQAAQQMLATTQQQ